MSTPTTFRIPGGKKGQLRIRFSYPALIILVVLGGVLVLNSPMSSATSGRRVSTDSNSKSDLAPDGEARRSRQYEAMGSSSSPFLSADKSVPSSFTSPRDYLLSASDSSLQRPSAPLAGTAETFASNCTTPKTDFNLGETVCGKITDVDFLTRKFSWVDPVNIGVQDGPTLVMSPQTSLFVIPATKTSVIGGGTVENRGSWTLVDRSTSNSSVQGSAIFRVHEAGHLAVDLHATGFANQNTNQITYTGCIFNQGGPDAAQNAKLQMTIPNNTTFASMTAPNGSWACTTPAVGGTGTVICTRSSLPTGALTGDCFQLVVTIDAGTQNNAQLTSKVTVSNDLEEVLPRTNVAVLSFNATTATTGPTIGYQAGAISIVSESCAAANSAIDPGELVTVSLCAQNYGNTASAATLLGTLQPIGGVKNPSVAQTYGIIAAGANVCRNFTFTAAGLQCGSQLTPTVVFTE